MRYNLIIDKITNPRSHNIVAHKLAGSLHIPLQKAQSVLENLPFIFLQNLTENEVDFELGQLTKIGVMGHKQSMIAEKKPQKNSARVDAHDFVDKPVVPAVSVLQPAPSSPQAGTAVVQPTPVVDQQRKNLFAETVADTAPSQLTSAARRRFATQIAGIIGVVGVLVLTYALFIDADKSLQTIIGRFMDRMRETQKAGIEFARAQSPSSTASSSGADSLPADSLATQVDSLAAAGIAAARMAVSSAQKNSAQSYVDSAATQIDSKPEKALYFYKMAIAFNKYNLNAWMGLATTYDGMGDASSAAATRRDMEALFGDRVAAIKELFVPYGTLTDVSLSPNGTYRIEYHSNVSSPDLIVAQAWPIIRDLAAQCDCRAISMYVTSDTHAGALVYCKLDPRPRTEAEFKKMAQIQLLK